MRNVPQRLTYLNIRSPVGGVVWGKFWNLQRWVERLAGGCSSLGNFSTPLPGHFLYFLLGTEDAISQLPDPAACCSVFPSLRQGGSETIH